MNPQRSRHKSRRGLNWNIPSLLGSESVLFLLCSCADLFMTYRLLIHGRFYEANPVANWFFHRWNIAGMAFFKLGLVIFVIILSEIIERHRPYVGRLILILGCLASGAAAYHGYQLLMTHG